jgi:hypothetical protein
MLKVSKEYFLFQNPVMQLHVSSESALNVSISDIDHSFRTLRTLQLTVHLDSILSSFVSSRFSHMKKLDYIIYTVILWKLWGSDLSLYIIIRKILSYTVG